MKERAKGPLQPEADEQDRSQDQALRPRTFDEYVGQERVKEILEIAIRAARERGDVLKHVLLHGPPGLGKTSLAFLIAREMGVSLRSTSGPAIERAGDLAAVLTNLEEGDLLFIDELHRLNRLIEEVLYPAMEDFEIDLMTGQGLGARTVKFKLRRFTLVGATTRAGLLSAPLRNRFGNAFRLDFYRPEELEKILERSARLLGARLEAEGGREIARRSRGTPRIANRLLHWTRDFAQVRADSVIRLDVARRALEMHGIDEAGLDGMDRTVLLTILQKFDGGPVGIETLAASIGEERDTLEDVHEPYLLQAGFLKRTPQGRVATPLAERHLGRPTKNGPQGGLFEP
jgi:Holliday junction DNA helicase RuvB